MAREVPRELSGRTIRKDQLERLVKAVEREFPSSSERRFSITADGETHTEASLDAVIQEAGGLPVVDNLTISDRDGDKTFFFESKRGLIKYKAGGGDRHFPVGFCEDVQGILRARASRVRRVLPARMRLIADWCLAVEAVMVLTAILATSLLVGWVAAVSSACASAAAFMITWIVRRHFTTYILLTDDAREPWKRAEKLTLVGMVVPVIVAAIVNGPTWFKSDEAPVAPKSGSVGQTSDSAEATASRAATSSLSRDTQRSPLAEVKVNPSAGPAGEPFVVTGEGFEPGADVWVELVAGPGTTLSKNRAERRLVRANGKGEIGPEKITVGRGVCCSRGAIRVVAAPEGNMAPVETAYKLE